MQFNRETADAPESAVATPWRILVADDEEQVHTMTRMVMKKFRFEGRGVEIISAYSGEETRRLMAENRDVAILFLDVVMEEEDAGLKVVQYVRETLNNPLVRIILRTGQPGQAPEEDVIRNYDINDYKSKTELTVKKLYTAVIASLRAYQDMLTIEKNKRGLEGILRSSRELFRLQTIEAFSERVLDRLDELTHGGRRGSGFVLSGRGDHLAVVARSGDYLEYPEGGFGRWPIEVRRLIAPARRERGFFFKDCTFLASFDSLGGLETFVFFEAEKPIDEVDQNLIKIFYSNIAVAIDNLYLSEEIIDTQKEVIITLGEIVETRSKETANHVRRVAEYSYLLGIAHGLDETEATLLRLASPMHDIGKIGIPDVILNKPAGLDAEEFEIIKTHTTIGYEVLRKSNRDILRAAATIAWQHHERWDGGGYPRGIAGDRIHVFARITAICDVYDALSHKRVYKDAWPEAEVLAYLRDQSGVMFDPTIVTLFFEHYPAIKAIKERYPNEGDR
jgi:response regulator RpfG family c-di-GMP phosphodiesterase